MMSLHKESELSQSKRKSDIIPDSDWEIYGFDA